MKRTGGRDKLSLHRVYRLAKPASAWREVPSTATTPTKQSAQRSTSPGRWSEGGGWTAGTLAAGVIGYWTRDANRVLTPKASPSETDAARTHTASARETWR